MLTKGINFTNFKKKYKIQSIKKKLEIIIKENNAIIQSLGKFYKYSFKKKISKNIQKILILELLVWEVLR